MSPAEVPGLVEVDPVDLRRVVNAAWLYAGDLILRAAAWDGDKEHDAEIGQLQDAARRAEAVVNEWDERRALAWLAARKVAEAKSAS